MQGPAQAFSHHRQCSQPAAFAHSGRQRLHTGDCPALSHRTARKAKSVVVRVASHTLLDELAERRGFLSVHEPPTSFLASPFHQVVPQQPQPLHRVAGDDLREDDVDMEARYVGTILGSMCGNALAAPLQHERHSQVMRQFPNGVTEFWAYDMSQRPLKRGHTTGEFEALLAVARSLVAANCCDARSIAHWMAYRCDLKAKRYTPHAENIIARLQDPNAQKQSFRFLASLPIDAAQQYAADPSKAALSFSDRWDREPWGPADHTAAVAVAAPIALAYRESSWSVVDDAVQEACLLSHSHPVGVDGARVMAAAVHWLLQQPASSGSGADGAVGPKGLLTYLMSVTKTADMRSKLELLQQQLFQVDKVQSWPAFYRSESWHKLRTVLARLTYHDMATAGTEATAVALWAFLTHWNRPHQAVCVAALFGGSGPATVQMVGALSGALHGPTWIPGSWWEHLENHTQQETQAGAGAVAPEGQEEGRATQGAGAYTGAFELKYGRVLGLRDEATMVAKQLAELRCDRVGLLQVEARK